MAACPVQPVCHGPFDIMLLAPLRAGTQKQDNVVSGFRKIDPVARSSVDSEFAHTSLQDLDVTEVALFQTVPPADDRDFADRITEVAQTIEKRVSATPIEVMSDL